MTQEQADKHWKKLEDEETLRCYTDYIRTKMTPEELKKEIKRLTTKVVTLDDSWGES